MKEKIKIERKKEKSLYDIIIEGYNGEKLPDLSKYKKINSLQITTCPRIKSIKGVLPPITFLNVDNCVSLESIGVESEVRSMNINCCPKLVEAHNVCCEWRALFKGCVNFKSIEIKPQEFTSFNASRTSLECLNTTGYFHNLGLNNSKIKEFKGKIQVADLDLTGCRYFSSFKNINFDVLEFSKNNIVSFDDFPKDINKATLSDIEVPNIRMNKGYSFVLERVKTEELCISFLEKHLMVSYSNIKKIVVPEGELNSSIDLSYNSLIEEVYAPQCEVVLHSSDVNKIVAKNVVKK